jgi:hypothetical protein
MIRHDRLHLRQRVITEVATRAAVDRDPQAGAPTERLPVANAS